MPINYILKSRRLNFLWYLLNEKDDSMLKEFFRAQCESPVKGDWVLTVLDDLRELGIQKSFDDICEMTKISFKKIVKSKVKEKALLFLKDLQKSHSKSKHLIYNDLNLQN